MTIEHTNQAPAVQKAPVALSRPLSDIDQAWRMASALAQSSLMPDALRGKASNVLVILMYGQELGLSPMQAIQGIYVVNNRPQMSGQLWMTKVRDAGHRYFVACKECDEPPEQHVDHRYEADHDTKRCTVTIVRGDGGERHSETFTWEDAERARLAKKDIWQSYPKRMLLWRALSSCATIACPEVAMGFGSEVPETEQAAPEDALAQAVDARQPAPDKPAEPDDVQDAEIVDEPSSEDLARADEEARREVAELAAEHEKQDDNGWPATAPIPGSNQ